MATTGMRELRRRKKTIENIKQITKAMMSVAAAKLKRVEEKCLQSRPYAHLLQEVVSYISLRYIHGEIKVPQWHNFFFSDEEKRCLLLFTSNQGLCGSYNTNIIKEANKILQSSNNAIKLIILGKKGFSFFKKDFSSNILEYYPLPKRIDFEFAKVIADKVISSYISGEITSYLLIYNEFISALHQRVKIKKLLPLTPEPPPKILTEYIYEPNAEELLSSILTLYVNFQIYNTLLESEASEHGARMTAMQMATSNAEKLINSLTLAFNKARQESITKELLDIISTSEALKITSRI